MPSPSSSPPAKRPPFHAAAVVLHALWGAFWLVASFVLFAGCLLAAPIVALAADADDAIPAVIILGFVALGMLLLAAASLFTLFLAYKAWGMGRFWVWALLIWSIVHVSSGCGLLVTIVTVIGAIQVLERLDERAKAAPQGP